MIDMLIRRARLTAAALQTAGVEPGPDGLVAIHVDGDRFTAVTPHQTSAPEARVVIDACGALASPPYVEPHVHLDTCLTGGQPRGLQLQAAADHRGAGINLVCNPMVNLHLQGRFDAYPRRRGLTQVNPCDPAAMGARCFPTCEPLPPARF